MENIHQTITDILVDKLGLVETEVPPMLTSLKILVLIRWTMLN